MKMLLPSALKRPQMEFIEVEDLRTVSTVAPPKTQAQIERETYE